jgi:glycerate-2-kinase
VIGSNDTALAAAEKEARRLGYSVLRPDMTLRGEASECGVRLATFLRGVTTRRCCVLAGGETVVSVGRGRGRGGRCQELALAAAGGLATSSWTVLAAGTDGIDGQTPAAGAFCDGSTLLRGGRRNAAMALREHDAYSFFRAIGDLFVPGPTGTNVMDVAFAIRP